MKIGELVQRIQSLYSRGSQSDDSRLTSRHIYNKLVSMRSRLISEESKKKQKVNQWNYQTIPCVELEVAPPHECPCLPPMGCEILKTKYQLPRPLSNYDTHLIQSVTSLDGQIIFSEIGWTEKKYKAAQKYTAMKPDYFIRNNYLYVTHKIGTRLISITGLFEDPLEVDKFASYCDDCINCADCQSMLDKDFPIDNEKVDILIEMSVKELLVMFGQGKADHRNNNQDNSATESQQ